MSAYRETELVASAVTPPPPAAPPPPPNSDVAVRMKAGLRPCPKCDGRDTWMRYCDACGQKISGADCRHGEAEHFHRGCRQCSYEWRTDDVTDAKVVCNR